MPNGLPAAFTPSIITTYGAIHTGISVLPILIGLYLYAAKATIRLSTPLGKAYWATAFVGAVTGITIFHHGGPGVPHVLSVIFLLLLAAAAAPKIAGFGVLKPRTVEVTALSTTYFLLWFFTTTEGLTRFPVGKPFAPAPEAAELIPVRAALLIMLVAGVWLQRRADTKLAPA